MSLFGKTIVVRGGLSGADVDALKGGFQVIAETVGARFAEQDARIEALEGEVARLKQEPRKSFREKLKARTG